MYLEPYLSYRQEIGREHTLLSGRISSLLTSQSLFLGAWALLFNSQAKPYVALVVVAVAAFLISAIGLLAAHLNCRLIYQWMKFARDRMIEPDKKKAEPELTLYNLGRPLNNWTSHITVGVLPRAFPAIFCLLWAGLLLYMWKWL